MTKRFPLLLLAISALLLLVFYSQWTPEAARVSGFIEADEIRLGSRVGGRVANVQVTEGQPVQAGEVLVELEPFDLLEREAQLEFSLAAAEADYKRFSNGFRDEEKAQAKSRFEQLQARLDLLAAGARQAEIEAARGRLSMAQVERKLAEQTFKRVEQLVLENAVSQQEVEAASEALEAAAANVVVRQQELNLLEAGTRKEELREAAARLEEAYQAWQLMEHGYRAEEIEQAQAARDAAQAALEAIRQQKEELNIKSPIDGSIESLDLQPGDMVAAGAPVLSMLDKDNLWVRAYVPQNRIGIKVGQTVRVTVDTYPDEPFTGTVSFVARQAEFTPNNVQTLEERSKQVFRFKVAIENRRDLLRPGMMADVWLEQAGGGE
ncbi:HlyD family secretion protein [Aureliella helgolandensis]|uniref:Multidrug export protein EmrA n=1 Tax=Aureliella helgolandensis TaxID=2527968 RepID=A0A518GD32_9BACT|nr:HlyD family efflux transporter periplasmic adaptor subunit [Aureliella helgolandensis]QDV26460.1 Multidrug export protein EmrA [Aureliella helgolandensis]